MTEIWFWQRMVTPHMSELAINIASKGFRVVYVAEELLSDERRAQGWIAPDLIGVELRFVTDVASLNAVVATAPKDSVHLCQGIRANGFVILAQRALKARRIRHWVVMETVDDSGYSGFVKRLEYRRLFYVWRQYLAGVLAIGKNMPAWVVSRGVSRNSVYPFAYFLRDGRQEFPVSPVEKKRYRLIFVGQLIDRKRLDLLFFALSRFCERDFEVVIVGSGPMQGDLKAIADDVLPNRVQWLGTLPITMVTDEIRNADCLILPSRHDGWGAVVSEAIMVGTPVICSDSCGAAEVVDASGYGGVFFSGNVDSLISHLSRIFDAGPISLSDRFALSSWGRCLGAEVGSKYLLDILLSSSGSMHRPAPPWRKSDVTVAV